jgi:hypothetical protein
VRSCCVLAVVFLLDTMGRSIDALGQHSSKRESFSSLVGDWVDYINGQSLKLVMHLEASPDGGLAGTIAGAGPNETETMQNIRVDGRSLRSPTHMA